MLPFHDTLNAICGLNTVFEKAVLWSHWLKSPQVPGNCQVVPVAAVAAKLGTAAHLQVDPQCLWIWMLVCIFNEGHFFLDLFKELHDSSANVCMYGANTGQNICERLLHHIGEKIHIISSYKCLFLLNLTAVKLVILEIIQSWICFNGLSLTTLKQSYILRALRLSTCYCQPFILRSLQKLEKFFLLFICIMRQSCVCPVTVPLNYRLIYRPMSELFANQIIISSSFRDS